MPRSSTLVTPSPIDAQAVAEAAGAVWQQLATEGAVEEFELRTVDEGAALQVLQGAELVVTVLPPRVLPRFDEVQRLRPGIDVSALPLPALWAEAYTPWEPAGMIGLAILEEIAAASSGIVAHDETPRA